MKRPILILTFLSALFPATTQSTFFLHYPTPQFECGMQVAETGDGSYIIVGEKSSDWQYLDVAGYVVKIDGNGNIIKDTVISDLLNPTRFSIIEKLFYPDTSFLVIGFSDSLPMEAGFYNKQLFNLLDQDLRIISQKKFSSPKNISYHPWQSDMVYDSLLYIMSVTLISPQEQQFSILKVRLPFDSLTSYTTSGTTDHLAGSLVYLKNKGILNSFFVGSLIKNQGLIKILQLDSNLNYLNSSTMEELLISTPCAKRFTDTSFILTATGKTMVNASEHILTMLMNNENDTLKVTEVLNNPDTILYAGGGINTAINSNSIFITGLYNLDPLTFPWQTSPIWLQIVRTDLNLNIKNSVFYGGDAEYFPYCIIATSDGGALVTGFRWDYNIPGDYQWDIFVLKVDSQGLVTNIPDDNTMQASEGILCPNPGKDYAIAILAVQYKEAELELFDLNGKSTMQVPLKQLQTRISTASLAPGVYVYNVRSGNKVIGKGKWIKSD